MHRGILKPPSDHLCTILWLCIHEKKWTLHVQEHHRCNWREWMRKFPLSNDDQFRVSLSQLPPFCSNEPRSESFHFTKLHRAGRLHGSLGFILSVFYSKLRLPAREFFSLAKMIDIIRITSGPGIEVVEMLSGNAKLQYTISSRRVAVLSITSVSLLKTTIIISSYPSLTLATFGRPTEHSCIWSPKTTRRMLV